jgi:hypothetical protein
MTMKCLYGLPAPIVPIAYLKTSNDHTYIFASGSRYYYWRPEAMHLVRIESDGLTDENVVLRQFLEGIRIW